jgi:hypothetical protein
MQNPVAPIIAAAFAGEEFYDAPRIIPRLSEIVDYCAAMVDESFLGVGAMENRPGSCSTSFK